jgi:hypothetical protein
LIEKIGLTARLRFLILGSQETGGPTMFIPAWLIHVLMLGTMAVLAGVLVAGWL